MSDTQGDFITNSNSKSHLIEVHHVGVTAQIQSPLKKLLPNNSTSTDSDTGQVLFAHAHTNKTKYDTFTNDTQLDTETTEESYPHVLYEMRAEPSVSKLPKVTPSRIEFQRYNRSGTKRAHFAIPTKRRKASKKDKGQKKQKKKETQPEANIFQRLRHTLDNMCQCKPSEPPNVTTLLDDLPEPKWNQKRTTHDAYIGIYPFDHGSADYLSITDNHPRINSILFAERATIYATHFWAEFFGFLHIGVAFVVTFILQCYRFLLYSLVNTLIVGVLHMTSDYLIKPILTVAFNGFLQPPMIFVYNVFSSVRDILEPIADTLNNLMKPLATVGRSLRLINVNYNQRHCTAKEV